MFILILLRPRGSKGPWVVKASSSGLTPHTVAHTAKILNAGYVSFMSMLQSCLESTYKTLTFKVFLMLWLMYVRCVWKKKVRMSNCGFVQSLDIWLIKCF